MWIRYFAYLAILASVASARNLGPLKGFTVSMGGDWRFWGNGSYVNPDDTTQDVQTVVPSYALRFITLQEGYSLLCGRANGSHFLFPTSSETELSCPANSTPLVRMFRPAGIANPLPSGGRPYGAFKIFPAIDDPDAQARATEFNGYPKGDLVDSSRMQYTLPRTGQRVGLADPSILTPVTFNAQNQFLVDGNVVLSWDPTNARVTISRTPRGNASTVVDPQLGPGWKTGVWLHNLDFTGYYLDIQSTVGLWIKNCLFDYAPRVNNATLQPRGAMAVKGANFTLIEDIRVVYTYWMDAPGKMNGTVINPNIIFMNYQSAPAAPGNTSDPTAVGGIWRASSSILVSGSRDTIIRRFAVGPNAFDGINYGGSPGASPAANIEFSDGYIWPGGFDRNPASHSDGLQCSGNARDVLIRNIYVENLHEDLVEGYARGFYSNSPVESCIRIESTAGPIYNVHVENNIFNGGSTQYSGNYRCPSGQSWPCFNDTYPGLPVATWPINLSARYPAWPMYNMTFKNNIFTGNSYYGLTYYQLQGRWSEGMMHTSVGNWHAYTGELLDPQLMNSVAPPPVSFQPTPAGSSTPPSSSSTNPPTSSSTSAPGGGNQNTSPAARRSSCIASALLLVSVMVALLL